MFAAIIRLIRWLFEQLPDGETFAPLPSSVTSSIYTGSGWVGWVLGLLGDHVKEAVGIAFVKVLS